MRFGFRNRVDMGVRRQSRSRPMPPFPFHVACLWVGIGFRRHSRSPPMPPFLCMPEFCLGSAWEFAGKTAAPPCALLLPSSFTWGLSWSCPARNHQGCSTMNHWVYQLSLIQEGGFPPVYSVIGASGPRGLKAKILRTQSRGCGTRMLNDWMIV